MDSLYKINHLLFFNSQMSEPLLNFLTGTFPFPGLQLREFVRIVQHGEVSGLHFFLIKELIERMPDRLLVYKLKRLRPTDGREGSLQLLSFGVGDDSNPYRRGLPNERIVPFQAPPELHFCLPVRRGSLEEPHRLLFKAAMCRYQFLLQRTVHAEGRQEIAEAVLCLP
ncbi:hypothetical protein D3C74_324020 [compost metagenome]